MRVLFKGVIVGTSNMVIGDGIHWPKSINYTGTCWIDGMRLKANDWIQVSPETVMFSVDNGKHWSSIYCKSEMEKLREEEIF